MISHVSLGVRNLERAAPFYDAVLDALGPAPMALGMDRPAAEKSSTSSNVSMQHRGQGSIWHSMHRPWRRSTVFHAAAMAAGGQDEGPPGLRPHYGTGYYAAFVRDPEGHKLEAVHHACAPAESGL